jgi:murein L,D-transpeptidase YcbB/YkuD
MITRGGFLVVVFGSLLSGMATAQIYPDVVQQVLEKEINRNTLRVKHPEQIRDFYQLYGYKLAWITDEPARRQLLLYIENAAEIGLRKEDYQPGFIESWLSNKITMSSVADSLLADFRFTDAAVHFFHDAAFGSQPPSIGYNGLNYSPGCFKISTLLASALSSGYFSSFLPQIELKSPEYLAVKNMMARYNKITRDTLYRKKLPVVSGAVNDVNKPLIRKLHELQVIDTSEKRIPPKTLIEKIKELQSLFSLTVDGVLSAAFRKELNVPLEARVEELNRALNTMRWLRCAREQNPHIIVVNIPSATLLVYGPGEVTMQSKVIVGSKSNRTPTLASRVTEVVLYPYWMVPKKIATKELLPLIKKDIGYIDANNFQVVNDQGKVVNPYSINWHELSTGNFPYTLRQSTGCDNSLGLVKLNFYSPYVVYLHDTPWKSLFNLNKRYFSHGCMRVEKAMDLARLVMKDNTAIIDTLTEKGCLHNQRPVPVTASEKMPVFVLYNTAWVDSAATVRFYGDVYNKYPVSRNSIAGN